jgi:5'-nucleotidase/UDP-sugar diphosphatase
MRKLALYALTFLIGALASAYQQDEVYKITILHTGDTHGHFYKNSHGEGGFAAQRTLIKRIKAEVEKNAGLVLVLSSGDINTGTPESSLLEARPDIEAMNLLGYDAMALGNHEFDYTQDVLRQQQGWARFPFLAANVRQTGTGQALAKSHIVKKFRDLRLAIVGLTTSDTPRISLPANTQGLQFDSPIRTAQVLVPKLNATNDVVFILGHLGYYPDAKHGYNAPGDVTLARKTAGVDAIFGGHTHDAFKTAPIVENNIPIVHSGENGRYLSRTDFEFLNGKLTLKDYRLIPINLKHKVLVEGKNIRRLLEKEIPEDPEMLSLITPYLTKAKEKLGFRIGEVQGFFDGTCQHIRAHETNLGNLMLRAQTSKVPADIAILNAGSIRDSIHTGPVTYSDVIKVHPFGNTICTVVLSGRELQEYLARLVQFSPGDGCFPHFYGITLNVRNKKIVSLQVNQEAISETRMYRVLLNSFIANGGDRYPNLGNHRTFIDTGFTLADTLGEYLKEHSPIRQDDFKASHYYQRTL